MTPRNLQTVWARLLVDSLARAGVTDVVISPGSRSTPFVLAAAAHAGLRCHDVIDERVASFFALGLARVTGRPAALLCTSGTAPAHYFPAVIEASVAGVPLLVLSADRPAELMDCAAPQTVDQTKLFGDHVRAFADLGSPDATARFLDATRRAVAQLVATSRGPRPGPVHLNLRARKPLEPVEAATDDERALEALAARIAAAPFPRAHTGRLRLDPADVAALAEALSGVAEGLVVAGPWGLAGAEAREAVGALCRATGWPLLAEATSQLRFGAPGDVVRVDAFDHVLAAGAPTPRVVVQLGLPPVSGAWEPWIAAQPGVRRVVVAPWGWNDPLGTADVVLADVADTIAALADAIRPAPDAAWGRAWAAREEAAWAAVGTVTGDVEGTVVRRAVAALPEGGQLVVGNSLAVRVLDQFTPGGSRAIPVLSQRGASGIDGLIAGAAGAATGNGRPTLLLLGDVSAVHDLNGLLVSRTAAPLVVLVLNNGGGRIFELLPVARHPAVPEAHLDHLTTPHAVDLGAAARAYGVPHAVVAPADLEGALRAAFAQPGCTLVEVPLPPHGAAEAHRAIRAASK